MSIIRRPRAFASLVVATTALATLALTAEPARACGGFFCSQIPVDQSGEQIIFGMSGGTITAQILINYTGAAESFAWLLPVASMPEISLGSAAAFQQLGYRTQPSWNLEWSGQAGQCGGWWYALDADGGVGGGPPRNDDGGVQVLSQKDVGPFKTVVLESTNTDDLVKWLDENGYDQPDESIPLLNHYVKQEMKFVALRLKKDEPAGAIQPIMLTFAEPDPCVPLVLTQIAAVPDMPVQLFLFADHRVVPTNWFHVVVNERRIDWLQYGSNYKQLVTAAVDEAAGHGFVTEYAGSSDVARQILYADGRFDTEDLAATHDPAAFVMKLLEQGFPRDSVMQQLLREYIPMPAALVEQGVTEQQFYNNLSAYAAELADQPFDPAAFVDSLEERVITPLRDTQALFDAHPKLTRLFTTVSDDEMNRDPVFAQNADLPDVSNQHTATANATCDGNDLQTLSVTLADGTVIEYVTKDAYPYAELPPELAAEPAAARIELVGREGAPVLVDPEKAIGIDSVLNSQSPADVLIDVAKDPFVPPELPDHVPPRESSGCDAGGHGVLWASLVGAWVILVSLGMRRRGR